MPYSSVSEVPSYVPKAKRKQWLEVFNSAYERAEGTAEEREASAFAQANSVAGPNAKAAKNQKHSQLEVGYEEVSTRPGRVCAICEHFEAPDSCEGVEGPIAAGGWCLRFDFPMMNSRIITGQTEERKVAFTGRKEMAKFEKFIPFAKVDASKREVWGIVTAEVPDKEEEVCDYAKSKPYYEETIEEQSNATDGENFMPLREMHQPSAVGKGIGYEFRDADREIFFGFKVVDDKAWKKVEEKVYTGFSHGGVKVGEMVPDPVFKNCMRYVAKPVEVSLVDNPCLGIARYTYVSKTGEVTLRKNRCVLEEAPVSAKSFKELLDTVEELKKSLQAKNQVINITEKASKETRTKRVAGEDLPPSAFLIVGDVEKTDTWHLPVKFSNEAKTKRHIINALSRINQVKGISEEQRSAAAKKLHSLAEKYGIDVKEEKEKLAAIGAHLRKALRSKVNRFARMNGDPGYQLSILDDDLGRLAKGMYEVGCMAQYVSCLTNLLYQVVCEQEWEKDESSPLPAMLESNVNDLLDTFVAMVAEEVQEQREEIEQRM